MKWLTASTITDAQIESLRTEGEITAFELACAIAEPHPDLDVEARREHLATRRAAREDCAEILNRRYARNAYFNGDGT